MVKCVKYCVVARLLKINRLSGSEGKTGPETAS